MCDPQAAEKLESILRDESPLVELPADSTLEECLNALDHSYDLVIEGEGGCSIPYQFLCLLAKRVWVVILFDHPLTSAVLC